MNLNSTLQVILIIASIFGGGVGAFFIIRIQLTRVLQEELRVYKDKVERMDKDIKDLTQTLGIVKTENLSLITERDYLRGIIISAITSKKDIHKELLAEIKNSENETRLYRDGSNLTNPIKSG